MRVMNYYTKEEIIGFHDEAEKEQSWGDVIFHYENGKVTLVRLEITKKKDSKQGAPRGIAGGFNALDKTIS